MSGSPGSSERGSATVLTVAAIGVVGTMAAAALLVTGLVRDVHRARGAADLAVLAAAGPLASGGPADCTQAAWVARANGARLTACELQGDGSVVVSVSVARAAGAGWLRGPGVVAAKARAGVAEEPPG